VSRNLGVARLVISPLSKAAASPDANVNPLILKRLIAARQTASGQGRRGVPDFRRTT